MPRKQDALGLELAWGAEKAVEKAKKKGMSALLHKVKASM